MHKYWNKIYTNKDSETLGWYEGNPAKSLELISQCKLNKDDRILITGAGSTTLVDTLIDMGYENIIANDISSAALEVLKSRLGHVNSQKVLWIVDDLTNPNNLEKIESVKLWFDRAVLHFFTEEDQRKMYFDLLRKLVSKNGYVILAQFNTSTATMCSGLPVYRYNLDMLESLLGSCFQTIQSFNYTYTMPSGDTREYVYGLFYR